MDRFPTKRIEVMAYIRDDSDSDLQQQVHSIFAAIHERIRRNEYLPGKWSSVFIDDVEHRFRIEA